MVCLLFIAQLLIIEGILVRNYFLAHLEWAGIFTVPFGILAALSVFYFYRFTLRPLPPENKLIPSYLFLKLWRLAVVGTAGIVAFVLGLRLLTGSRHLLEVAFLPVWIATVVFVMIDVARRLKMLEGTESFRTIDARIKRAGFTIRFGSTQGTTGSYYRKKKVGLSHVHWMLATSLLFVLIGVGLLIMVVAMCVTGKLSGFIFVPLSFGIVFTLFPLYVFSKVLGTVLGKDMMPSVITRLGSEHALNKSLLPEKGAGSQLVMYIFALIVLFVFSIAALMQSLVAGAFTYIAIAEFVIALVCSFIGFNIVQVCLEGYRKEKKRKKPTFSIATIGTIQKGLIITGHIFGYLIILGGLLVISLYEGNRFTLTLGKLNTHIPWISVVWFWITFSELALFHQDFKAFYPAGWTPPLIVRFTGTLTLPLQIYLFLNVVLLVGKVLESLLSVIVPLFGKEYERGRGGKGGYTLPDAESMAYSVAMGRDREAYLIALKSGDEGITLDDQRANGWVFSYFLPKRKRRLDIHIVKGKVQLKRSTSFSEEPPEAIPRNRIDPLPVLKKAQEEINALLKEDEEERYTFFLYLPSTRFFEELAKKEVPTERSCWIVSSFDGTMEFFQDFFIDLETHENVLPHPAV